MTLSERIGRLAGLVLRLKPRRRRCCADRLRLEIALRLSEKKSNS